MADNLAQHRAGLWLGLGAYLCWGVTPLYFGLLLTHVPATQIIAHRIVWSLFFLGALVLLWRRWPAVRAALGASRVMMTLAVTALLVSANWLIYIWAITNGHVLASSLGYYLNPLVNVLLGVALLKERLTRAQTAAVLLAALGVAALAVRAAEGLWISLALALTFGLYGFIRKIAPVDAIEGLGIETAILAPVSLLYLLWLQGQGQGGFVGQDGWTILLLVAGAVVTTVPLLLFNAAAKRLPYSTLGFLQYIAPSIQFLLAVLVFGEHFTTAHALCFGAIWTALAIFAWEGVRLGRARARAADEMPEPCP